MTGLNHRMFAELKETYNQYQAQILEVLLEDLPGAGK